MGELGVEVQDVNINDRSAVAMGWELNLEIRRWKLRIGGFTIFRIE
jgi:hypothetical protein